MKIQKISLAKQTIQESVATNLSNAMFGTTTFSHPTTDLDEVVRIRTSFIKRLNYRHLPYCWTMGYQESGRLHYHYVVFLPDDVQLGTNIEALAGPDILHDLQEALSDNANFWSDKLCQLASKSGFGLSEFTPIYSSPEQVAVYQSNHLSGSVQPPRPKMRMFGCSLQFKLGTIKFSMVGGVHQRFRQYCRWRRPDGCGTLTELIHKRGSESFLTMMNGPSAQSFEQIMASTNSTSLEEIVDLLGRVHTLPSLWSEFRQYERMNGPFSVAIAA